MDEEKKFNFSMNYGGNNSMLPVIISAVTLLLVIICFFVVNGNVTKVNKQLEANNNALRSDLQNSIDRLNSTESTLIKAVTEIEEKIVAAMPEKKVHPLPNLVGLKTLTVALQGNGKIFVEHVECQSITALLKLVNAVNAKNKVVVILKAENSVPIRELVQVVEGLKKNKIEHYIQP